MVPLEINRIITDRLSSLYFTPSADADQNLLKEGVSKNKIHFVGNVMIDTLVRFLPKIRTQKTKLDHKRYGVLTLHRPSNVDDKRTLRKIFKELNIIAEVVPLIFPVHPRTKKMLESLSGFKLHKHLILSEPMGYLDFLSLVRRAAFVITDSGGIQEETTYLGVPCLTLRKNTERPITITMGTNTLIGNDFKSLNNKIDEILKGTYKKGNIPPKWDGKAAERIAKIIVRGAFSA